MNQDQNASDQYRKSLDRDNHEENAESPVNEEKRADSKRKLSIERQFHHPYHQHERENPNRFKKEKKKEYGREF